MSDRRLEFSETFSSGDDNLANGNRPIAVPITQGHTTENESLVFATEKEHLTKSALVTNQGKN